MWVYEESRKQHTSTLLRLTKQLTDRLQTETAAPAATDMAVYKQLYCDSRSQTGARRLMECAVLISQAISLTCFGEVLAKSHLAKEIRGLLE